MAEFFKFEADFVDSLRCIPMLVRFKLDTCGIKLQLAHWHQFNNLEREQLVDLPCHTESEVASYRHYLQQLVIQYTGLAAKDLAIDPHPAWLNSANIPDLVTTKSIETNIPLTVSQWAILSPLQRFALIKLSRSSHENNNFLPAIQEFGLN
jgi:hypothetical protein